MIRASSSQNNFHWIAIAIILLTIVATYGQTLRFDFVNYDDYPLICQNANFLNKPSNIVSAFSTHAFGASGREGAYYRPLLLVSYIFDYQIWGLNPAGYHLTNIVLHFLTTIFVFLLIKSLVRDQLASLFAGLLFALHPVQVESVAWISGRDNILMGLGIVMMMYFYIRQYENQKRRALYVSLSVFCFTLALFAKEAAVLFIFLFPLYEYSFRLIPLRTQLSRRYLVQYLVYWIPLIAYVFFRTNVVGGIVGLENLYGTTPVTERFIQLPAVLCEHLSLIVFPIQLCVHHPLDQLLWQFTPWNIIAAVIVTILPAMLWFLWRHNRQLFFAYGWLIIGLLPLLNILPLAVPIMEHRLYTSMLGIVLLICIFMYRYIHGHRPVIATSLLSVLVMAAAIGTMLRMPAWQNSETLWRDTIEKAPTSYRAYFNLAGYYFERGEYERTIPLLNKCTELQPEDYNGYSKLIQTYTLLNQPDDIASVYRRMILVKPHQQSRYLELGNFFEQRNQPDSALIVYNQGLRTDSNFYQLHYRIGLIYHARDDLSNAEYHYSEAIKIKSDFAVAYFKIAVLEVKRRNISAALQYIENGKLFGQPPPEIDTLFVSLRNMSRR